jgi:RimJ/RimL family protein N-acetyltransferase
MLVFATYDGQPLTEPIMSPLAPSQFTMRPMTLDDIDTVAAWLQDVDDLSLFDRNMAVPPNQDTVRDSWKADLTIAKFPTAHWFVTENYDRKPVAIGGLQSINYVHGDAVLPILVSKSVRGKGLGVRVAIVLLDLAFDRLRLRRVTTFFRSDNLRTERLTKRVGFQQEGRMREAWFADGRFLDCMVVGLLRAEWHARREALRGGLDNSIEVVLRATNADHDADAPGPETSGAA